MKDLQHILADAQAYCRRPDILSQFWEDGGIGVNPEGPSVVSMGR